MKTMMRRTLVPAVLAMALAVGACSPVDDNPNGGTPPPQLTTTTTLDS